MENLSFKVAEIGISYRPTVKMAELPQVTSSKAAYEVLMDHWEDGRLELVEEFKVILLNRRAKGLRFSKYFTGCFFGDGCRSKGDFCSCT